MELKPDNIVRANQSASAVAMKQLRNDLETSFQTELKYLESKIAESLAAIKEAINRQQDLHEQKENEITDALKHVKDLQEQCRNLLPIENKPESPLDEVLESRSLEKLEQFMEKNDPNEIFPPNPNHKPATMLSFLQQSSFLIPTQTDLALEWISSCLLDLDTNDTMIKRFSPVIFKSLIEKLNGINNSKARAIKHIIRSLSLDNPQ